MLLSEDKISHLSHLILKGLTRDRKTTFLVEDEKVLREIKRVIVHELEMEEEIDQTVRAKLASYSRRLSEGGPEWEVLYHKFFEEERKKRRR
jgi:uncharacterized protein